MLIKLPMGKEQKFKILLVEDNDFWQLAIEERLKKYGLVDVCSSSIEAKSKLSQNNYDIAFLDLDLEKRLAGFELVSLCSEKSIYNVILTGNESEEIISQGYKIGANEYITKDAKKNHFEIIFQVFKNKLNSNRLNKIMNGKFITQDEILLNKVSLLSNLNIVDKPIFIQGESGVGKRVLALVLNEYLNESGPFIEWNCKNLRGDTAASKLFGYEKGAFTGADKKTPGILDKAQNGLLFLDEIHLLPPDTQEELLKVVDEGVFTPEGSQTPILFTGRFIFSSREGVEKMVEENKIVEHFYNRIKTFEIEIPPLRERKGDISLLLDYFLRKKHRKIILEADVKAYLNDYHWRNGNTREIEDLVENWYVDGLNVIRKENLPQHILNNNDYTDPNEVLPIYQLSYIEKFGIKAFESLVRRQAYNSIRKVVKNDSEVARLMQISNGALSKIKKQWQEAYE